MLEIKCFWRKLLSSGLAINEVFLQRLSMNNEQRTSSSIGSDGITFNADIKINYFKVTKIVLWNLVFLVYFVFATIKYVQRSNCAMSLWSFADERFSDKNCDSDCDFKFCSPYILLVVISSAVYIGIFYVQVIKKRFGKCINRNVIEPSTDAIRKIFRTA